MRVRGRVRLVVRAGVRVTVRVKLSVGVRPRTRARRRVAGVGLGFSPEAADPLEPPPANGPRLEIAAHVLVTRGHAKVEHVHVVEQADPLLAHLGAHGRRRWNRRLRRR